MEEAPGYILRISTDDWLEQVSELKKYFTGVIRHWNKGTTILFAKKVDVDSFVGYGVVDTVQFLWEMTPEEEAYCRENGWKQALTFQPFHLFEKALPIKESPLKGDRRKGAFLHGAKISAPIVDDVIDKAMGGEK